MITQMTTGTTVPTSADNPTAHPTSTTPDTITTTASINVLTPAAKMVR